MKLSKRKVICFLKKIKIEGFLLHCGLFMFWLLISPFEDLVLPAYILAFIYSIALGPFGILGNPSSACFRRVLDFRCWWFSALLCWLGFGHFGQGHLIQLSPLEFFSCHLHPHHPLYQHQVFLFPVDPGWGHIRDGLESFTFYPFISPWYFLLRH